jgi:hypothetical protein
MAVRRSWASYEIRTGSDGTLGIFTRDYNVRLATFSPGSGELQAQIQGLIARALERRAAKMRSDECEHEDYEVDPLTGRASCQMCSATWWLSEAEYLHHIDMQSAWERNWEEYQREINSPWNRFKEWCRRRWPNGWRNQIVVPDDDIPF